MLGAERSDAQDAVDYEAFFMRLLTNMYAMLIRRGVCGSLADDLASQSVTEVVRLHGTRPADLRACERNAFARLRHRWIDEIRSRSTQSARRSALRGRARPAESDASAAMARDEDHALVRRIFDRVPADLRPLATLWKTRIDDETLARQVGCTVRELQARKKRLVRALRQIVRDERIDVAGLLSSLGD
jgi:DNA-directed RNA polymerase specialized sigma24 family protein